MKAAVKRFIAALLAPLGAPWRYVTTKLAEIHGGIGALHHRLDEAKLREEEIRVSLDEARVRIDESKARDQDFRAQLGSVAENIIRLKGDVQANYFHNWSADKRIVSPIYGGDSARVLTLMRLLEPHDVRDRQFRRVGREFDGGYVMIDDFSMVKAAVSCGIEGEVSWDREMAALGFDVHQFDHTVEKPPEENARFHFNKLAIRASEAEAGITLRRIAEKLDGDAKGAILKLDIERSEWGVLAAVEEDTLAQFSQIMVEFHEMHYMPLFMEQAEAAFQRLARQFFVAHVHANNHEEAYSIGGVIVPRVLEVTFANRAWFEPAPLTRRFPTELDRRNDPRRPEMHLGRFAY